MKGFHSKLSEFCHSYYRHIYCEHRKKNQLFILKGAHASLIGVHILKSNNNG